MEEQDSPLSGSKSGEQGQHRVWPKPEWFLGTSRASEGRNELEVRFNLENLLATELSTGRAEDPGAGYITPYSSDRVEEV